MSVTVEGSGLTVLPEMVRLNGSRDADWMTAIWSLVRAEATAGRSVQVIPKEVTYSPAEVARMVGVSKMTVLRRIQDGTVEARKRGTHWRVAEAEVDRYSRFLMDQMSQLEADDLDL
jgi:excisionase family DNA binding protein